MASKDERYGSGSNERWSATEKRRGQSLRVRFGNQHLASDGFGDGFKTDGRRMRVGNEVALQVARQTPCIAAAISGGRRTAVVCRDDGGVRERRRVVMMGQRDKQGVRRQTQKDERRDARAPVVPGCEVAALLQRLLSLRCKFKNQFNNSLSSSVNAQVDGSQPRDAR